VRFAARRGEVRVAIRIKAREAVLAQLAALRLWRKILPQTRFKVKIYVTVPPTGRMATSWATTRASARTKRRSRTAKAGRRGDTSSSTAPAATSSSRGGRAVSAAAAAAARRGGRAGSASAAAAAAASRRGPAGSAPSSTPAGQLETTCESGPRLPVRRRHAASASSVARQLDAWR